MKNNKGYTLVECVVVLAVIIAFISGGRYLYLTIKERKGQQIVVTEDNSRRIKVLEKGQIDRYDYLILMDTRTNHEFLFYRGAMARIE
jgi:hypothetical protein